MVSIDWVIPANDGIANSLGYSHHNRMMIKYTEQLINIKDKDAKIALHIAPADKFFPIANKINVLFTMWEMIDIPESYKKGLARADYVIVPCKFCKDLFRQYTKRTPFIIGEGIEPKSFQYYQRSKPKDGERLRIYWAGAPNPRKGYHYALELWKYISKRNDIELYMKTTFPKLDKAVIPEKAKALLDKGYRSELLKKAQSDNVDEIYDKYMRTEGVNYYGENKNLIFDTRRVSLEELESLYQQAHIFIFPSMGEGWGLMGCEAMATGLPVIAPEITGIKEYFDDKVGYPIKTVITNIESSNYNFTARSYMPDPQDFILKVFKVIDNYSQALIKGKVASKRIHEQFTWDKQAKRLVEYMEYIEKENANNKQITITEPKISICIPTYNRKEMLKELLESIDSGQCEICITDNGNDGTDEMVKNFTHLNIKYKKNEINLGADLNFVECVKMASCEYCWLFGSDDQFVSGAIDNVIKLIDSKKDLYLLSRIECTDQMQVYGVRKWLKCNSRDFNLATDYKEYLSQVESLGGLFSFISNLVFKKSIFKYDGGYTGKGYIHMYILLQQFKRLNMYYDSREFVFCRNNDDYTNAHGVDERIIFDLREFLPVLNIIDEDIEEYIKKIMRIERPKETMMQIYERKPEIKGLLEAYNYFD